MTNGKLGVYHQVLIVFLLIFMFGGVADSGYSFGVIPVRPIFWSVLLFAAVIPILLSTYRVQPDSVPLFVWGIAYLLMVLLGQLAHASKPIELNSLVSSISFVALLFSSLVIFSTPFASTFAARVVLWISLFSVSMSVYEFFNPGVFSATVGRSAGLYINPNTNGSILVMGMILSMGAVPPKYRMLYQIVILLGVVTTLSRGALLCWIISFIFLQFSNAGSRNVVRQWLVVLISIAVLYMSPLWLLIQKNLGTEDTSRQALTTRLDPSQYGAAFSDVRIDLVKEAWTMFQARPFTGYGLGIPLLGGGLSPQGPHNMVLSLSIQFGILGGLMFLVLIAVVYRSGSRYGNSVSLVFSIFILVGSFFTHNMFDQTQYAIGISLATALALEKNIQSEASPLLLAPDAPTLGANDMASMSWRYKIGEQGR